MITLSFLVALWAALITCPVGIAYGKRLFRRGFLLNDQIRVRDCPLIPIGGILFVVAHILTGTITGNPTIGWALPVPIEYYLTPSLWVLKIVFATFALSAIATVGYRQGHPLRLPILLFSVVVVLGMDQLTRRSVQPNLGQIQDKTLGGIILQTNPSTCAAASAANIARHFGIHTNEADMVQRLNTTWAGTSPAQLIYGFRALGLQAVKVNVADLDLNQVHPPAILLVKAGGEADAHAVAYMGRIGPAFEVWDPNNGRKLLDAEAIRERWDGHAIEVKRPQRVEQDPPGVV